jgi:hypothetical protein
VVVDRPAFLLLLLVMILGCRSKESLDVPLEPIPTVFRAMTFNLEDVRTEDLLDPDNPRLLKAASIIHELSPDVLLLNELAYDQPGAPGYQEDAAPGQNGKRFVDYFLAPQGTSIKGRPHLRYRAFMAPSNTGLASGFDLNRDDQVQEEPLSRGYGEDSLGYGTFPGQYGMALLVWDAIEILEEKIRTFRLLPWREMPGALLPQDPETGEPWYSDEALARLRLSSKSHWDVPVRLPDGTVIHLLCSHPTPPAFDGPEGRNKRRNHDEIRFWADYLDGASYIVDDDGKPGGLPEGALFVILGDLNADPKGGASLDNPIGRFLLDHPRVQGDVAPRASDAGLGAFPDLDPHDTSTWGHRVDYVLPSLNLRALRSGIWRPESPDDAISDHFPVWVDLEVLGPQKPE